LDQVSVVEGNSKPDRQSGLLQRSLEGLDFMCFVKDLYFFVSYMGLA